MDTGARGMTPLAMNINTPRKENWSSRASKQRSPVVKFCALLTERRGLAHIFVGKELNTRVTHKLANLLLGLIAVITKLFQSWA